MPPTVKVKTSAAGAPPTERRIELEMRDFKPLRGSVRFDSPNGRKDAVHALYVHRKQWEQLGRPEAVRLTIEPLS